MLPLLPTAEWHVPWPWEIPLLYEKSRFENSIDEEAVRAYAKQAQLRLFDPLQRAREGLHASASQHLNNYPVAGIAHTLAWIGLLIAACERQLQSVFDWDSDLNETGETLAVARGQLEGIMKEDLARYPGQLSGWLPLLARPWRWPRLLFTYWRLQTKGQQLCQIFEQQAALRRERIRQQTAYHGTIELMQTARHLGDQVEEIGQMLHYLRRSLTAEADESAEAESVIPLTHLPVPDDLYAGLVTDAAMEAQAAAAAVGGLGAQIRHLDDAIRKPLLAYARSRLAGLNQVAVAKVMLGLGARDNAAIGSLLQRGWEAASPLWPVDAASLDEMSRLQQERLTVLCGSDTQLLVEPLSSLAEAIHTMPSGWTQHLWLVRLHIGLTPKMGPTISTKEMQSYE